MRSMGRAARWRARARWNPAYVIFSVLFAMGCLILLKWGADRVTLFILLITGAVIWWQGHLIRRQMELNTTIDLYKEWNSAEMLRKRRTAWKRHEAGDGWEPDPRTIEDVLEFLEKVSTFEKQRFLPRGLIWDTFGWYVWRYYFYCANVIGDLRNTWGPGSPDPTLYRDLEEFYPKMLRMELAERNYKRRDGKKLTEKDVEQELDLTRDRFIESETSLADD